MFGGGEMISLFMRYMFYVAIARFIFPDYNIRLIILIGTIYTLVDAFLSSIERRVVGTDRGR